MQEERVQRKLAAVLAADVVGYSRLMGEDDEATLAAFKAAREVTDGLIAGHRGRVFGAVADSVFAEFASPVEAVRCAAEIQLELDRRNGDVPEARRLRFRIGVNLGDVIDEGDHLRGDGVNVAARLEALAAPGGVCVSEAVVDQVRDRVSLEFLDLGEYTVKNIARPVRVYRVPLASEQPISSPFRGLDIFEFKHAGLFFGRAEAIAATKERLERQAETGTAFLLIYGMSGVGKSSLLRAGLLPALVEPGSVAGIALWRTCLVRPSRGATPIDALLDGLLSAVALPELAAAGTAEELAKSFHDAPDKAPAVIRTALAAAAEAARVEPGLARLVVAVDQVEDLFTAEGVDEGARERFVRLLGALAQSGFVWVVGTIRADFFHRCGEVPGFSALKDGLGCYELVPPTGLEIAQIIREPARAAGLRFEEDLQQGHLADLLQQAAARHPGALPLLEFVLDTLYEAGKESRVLTFAAYRALGGLEGAIAQRADAVTGALPGSVQDALPAVIRALTTVRRPDLAPTARSVPRREIAATPARAALVDALSDARLLVSDEGTDGEPMVRFAHEALLSQWPLAREIVAANREFLATRARIRADARRWRAEQRSPDLLLPAGKRLAEAADLLATRRDEVDDETVRYVEASDAANEARQQAARETERRHLAVEASAARLLARRTRVAALITLVLAIVAGAGAFVGFTGQNEAVRQADVALGARDEALAARNEALRNQSLFLAGMSLGETASGNTTAGILLGLEALPQDLEGPGGRPYVIEAEAALYRALFAHREILLLSGHDAAVMQATFSADGRRLATVSSDGTARIWDASSGAELVVLAGHDGAVQHADFSPDGTRLVTASHDGTARIWDAASGIEQVRLIGHGEAVFRAEFGPHGDRIVTASADGTARLWDAATGAELVVMRGHATEIQHAEFNGEGDRIVTASVDGTARLWDVADGAQVAVLRGRRETEAFSLGTAITFLNAGFSPDGSRVVTALLGDVAQVWDAASGTELARLDGHEWAVQHASFSPDGGAIVTASWDHTARVWDAADGTVTAVLRGHEALIFWAEFGPDGSHLVTASADGTARLWDRSTGAEIAVLRGHSNSVVHAAFSPDGARIVTSSTDGTARLWDATRSSETMALAGHDGLVLHAGFSPGGETVVTASADGTARLWRVSDATPTGLLRGHLGEVRHAGFSADGRLVATASSDHTARLWDIAHGLEIAVLGGHEGVVNQASFNPDASRVLTASDDATARVWDVASGGEVHILRGHEREINHAVYGPGGARILTVSADGTGRLWDPTDGQEVAVLRGHERSVDFGAFDPSGERALTVSEDRTVRIWDAATGALIAVLRGHNGAVLRAAFSPDGTRIVTAARDNTARIWDAATGQELRVLSGHRERVNDAAFSPDAARVVTGSKDGTLRLWDAETGAGIAVLSGQGHEIFRVAFSPDGRRILTRTDDHVALVFNAYPTTRAIMERALRIVPRALTACERQRFFLPVVDDLTACRS